LSLVISEPEKRASFLRVQARRFLDLIARLLNLNDLAIRTRAMSAIDAACDRLSPSVLARFVQVIVERMRTFEFDEKEFCAFIEFVGSIASPDRAALTDLALDLLRDCLKGDGPVINELFLWRCLLSILGLGEKWRPS
jgi:hypothetical protein